jgi:hypothetical protein
MAVLTAELWGTRTDYAVRETMPKSYCNMDAAQSRELTITNDVENG